MRSEALQIGIRSRSFLLCDQHMGTDDDRIFVLQSHNPRFLMEFVEDAKGSPS